MDEDQWAVVRGAIGDTFNVYDQLLARAGQSGVVLGQQGFTGDALLAHAFGIAAAAHVAKAEVDVENALRAMLMGATGARADA